MLDARHLYLVPPALAEGEELTVVGEMQCRALGDALADIPLKAVYAGPGNAAQDTATAVAQRHGFVVRRKPSLTMPSDEHFDVTSSRVVETFENIARAGPGRTSLLVTSVEAARIILSHCTGQAPSPDDRRTLKPASITEITIEEVGYIIERLGDTKHLVHLE